MGAVRADGKKVNLIAPEWFQAFDNCAVGQFREQIPAGLERDPSARTYPVMNHFATRRGESAVDLHRKFPSLFPKDPRIDQPPASD